MNLTAEQHEIIEDFYAAAAQMLSKKPRQSSEELRAFLADLASFNYPDANDEIKELVARRVEAANGVRIAEAAIIHDDSALPWLDDAKKTIDPFYWKRYQRFITADGLPRDVVSEMDRVTDKILSQLGNPHSATHWQRKGMVVGHVQSGKTANYTGLICKAADAGYRLIIVIAGIHNNLRNQTQERIDLGLIGRDSNPIHLGKSSKREIGVGLIEPGRWPVTLTTSVEDFKKSTATTNRSQIDSYKVPVVLVIKKQHNTLNNLISWLRENSAEGDDLTISQPMLLIDDEADNASINTKYGKKEVTKINGQIRDLLQIFHRSCYVGYTATPFANIFIDPDHKDEMYGEDLFPRNFIIGLDAPDNYFGGQKVFIDGMPDDEDARPTYVRYISDNDEHLPIVHPQDYDIAEIPDSLVYAIRSFFLARAIRNLRGQSQKHSSMLVNASRFTRVQTLLRNRIHDKVQEILDALRINGARGTDGLRDPEVAALFATWKDEFSQTEFSWDEIQDTLYPAVAATKVVEVNSKVNDLEYKTPGTTTIAVGGFSLSRGLTLEGLTTTWFLRNTRMYDTLMQMGRWFGYRTDHEDLCRIWMPKAASRWYAHIASASQELMLELKQMEQARATPLQFGLAVRAHSASLLITARNKIGSGVETTVSVGLSNNFVETARLPANTTATQANREAAMSLLQRLSDDGFDIATAPQGGGGKLLKGVKLRSITPFLKAWQNSSASITTQIEPILTYIEDRLDELEFWDVLIGSKESGPNGSTIGHGIIPIERSIGIEDLSDDIISLGKHNMRVSSRSVEKHGLTRDQILKTEKKYRDDKKIPDTETKINYPGKIYRETRERPLFVLYFVQVKKPEEATDLPRNFPTEPVAAWAISFPKSAKPDKLVRYVINQTKQRILFGEDDQDEIEEAADEG